jgi:hypothetical protein
MFVLQGIYLRRLIEIFMLLYTIKDSFNICMAAFTALFHLAYIIPENLTLFVLQRREWSHFHFISSLPLNE